MHWFRLQHREWKLIWTYVRFERRNLMKLYFYILDSKQEFNAKTRKYGKVIFKIRCEECNVIEKSKTYKPVDVFPKGIYSFYIRKENIGTFVNSYKKAVVLDEKNYEKAKEVFLRNFTQRAEELKEKLSVYEDMIAAVNVGEEDRK